MLYEVLSASFEIFSILVALTDEGTDCSQHMFVYNNAKRYSIWLTAKMSAQSFFDISAVNARTLATLIPWNASFTSFHFLR